MGTIYCWFEDFFGQDLAEHLWGWDMTTGDYTKANQFNTTGLVMIAISLTVVLLFYYAINHPRFNRWWSWLLVLLANAGLNFIYAWQLTLSDFNTNSISDDLMYVRDVATNEIITQKITMYNCIYFGIVNAIVATLAFVIFSFLFRWWSRNCSTCPFPN